MIYNRKCGWTSHFLFVLYGVRIVHSLKKMFAGGMSNQHLAGAVFLYSVLPFRD